MIKSVKVTPLYEEWENLGFKQVTGFGVYVMCGAKDVDEIFNLIKKNGKSPVFYRVRGRKR